MTLFAPPSVAVFDDGSAGATFLAKVDGVGHQTVFLVDADNNGIFDAERDIDHVDSSSIPFLNIVPQGDSYRTSQCLAQGDAGLLTFTKKDASSLPIRQSVPTFDIHSGPTGASAGITRNVFSNDLVAGGATPLSVNIDHRTADIAINSSGDAVVSWVMNNNTRKLVTKFRTCSEVYPDSSTTSHEIVSDYPNIPANSFDEHLPKVAIGQTGDAIVVWPQEQNDVSKIHYRRFWRRDASHRCGEGWTIGPVGVISGPAEADDPEVAVITDGQPPNARFLVVWREVDGTGQRVVARILSESILPTLGN